MTHKKICKFFMLVICYFISFPIQGQDINVNTVTDTKGVMMVLVPSGSFQFGTTLEHSTQVCKEWLSQDASAQELCDPTFLTGIIHPVEEIEVNAFYLDVYEVSLDAYMHCVEVEICSWQPLRNLDVELTNVPMRSVSYYDAAIYCAWREARLPTEMEWEYAARGTSNLDFVWGDTFDGTLTNFCDENCSTSSELRSNDWNDGYTDVAPIGAYEGDKSWAGVYDLAGNVTEWTSTPIQVSSGQPNVDYHIVKGGNFRSYPYQTAGWFRYWLEAENRGQTTVGFRCAKTSLST
jgi:formylglycine-generating enzyme required for sulfatase activity